MSNSISSQLRELFRSITRQRESLTKIETLAQEAGETIDRIAITIGKIEGLNQQTIEILKTCTYVNFNERSSLIDQNIYEINLHDEKDGKLDKENLSNP